MNNLIPTRLRERVPTLPGFAVGQQCKSPLRVAHRRRLTERTATSLWRRIRKEAGCPQAYCTRGGCSFHTGRTRIGAGLRCGWVRRLRWAAGRWVAGLGCEGSRVRRAGWGYSLCGPFFASSGEFMGDYRLG
jgi:hypothetical protein